MTTDLLAPISALGEQLSRAWLSTGRAPAALPALATAALDEATLHKQVSLSSLVWWAIRCPRNSFPSQADPQAQFGDPPITLWRGTQLRIDLQIWVDSAPDIHDHAFSGAFQVLSGSSLQGLYTFCERHRYSPALRLGELHQHRLEHLRPGDVRPIAPGHRLIHSLFHLERPSATLVIRTDGTPDYAPQSIYLPPGLASASYPAQLQSDPLFQRRLQLLLFYQRTGDPAFGEALNHLVLDADPLQLLSLLGYVFDALACSPGGLTGAAHHLSGLLSLVGDRYPELGPHLLPVFRRAHCRKLLIAAREQIHDPDLRALLALLVYAPDRRALLSATPSSTPAAWLADTLARLASSGGLPVFTTVPAAAEALSALLAGRPIAPDVEAALRADGTLLPLLAAGEASEANRPKGEGELSWCR